LSDGGARALESCPSIAGRILGLKEFLGEGRNKEKNLTVILNDFASSHNKVSDMSNDYVAFTM
jgi:hypothetical protein